jgi:2-keto-3-deoxy-L-rhamnonate aldolase RhmA
LTSNEVSGLAVALVRIAAVYRAQGRVAGIWCSTAEMGHVVVALGYCLVVPGHDASCLKQELTRRLGVLRAA